MFIIYGWKDRPGLTWDGILRCPTCGWTKHYGLQKKTTYNLFFIPINTAVSGSRVVCVEQLALKNTSNAGRGEPLIDDPWIPVVETKPFDIKTTDRFSQVCIVGTVVAMAGFGLFEVYKLLAGSN